MTMTEFHRTVDSYRQGAHTMPREYYTSGEIFERDRERIFARHWNCAGRASSIPDAGDFMLRDIAGESIIILRGKDCAIRAFFNICRHRGTRICQDATGTFSETIQCPYHAWTYSTDGRLVGAPHMNEVEGFDKRDYPLHSAAVAEWEGFVFVNVSDSPQPFADAFAPLLGRFARFNLPALRVGHSVRYDVHANWKLIFQNYSECLHCPAIHPELAGVMPYQSGANDLTEGPFLGGYMELREPHESATLSGRACGRVVSDVLTGAERRRAYYYSIMPNMLLSMQPDYVNYYILTPVAVDRTIVESEWMFHPDCDADPAFNPDDAVGFWDVTNRQDWDIVARSQQGIASRRYQPGPYSPRESVPAAWDRNYLLSLADLRGDLRGDQTPS
jgi:glycine betaine catabolism A